MSDVPANWATAPLAEICDRIVDGSHNPPKGTDDGHPMLSARNISNGQIVFDDFRWISNEDFAVEDARTRVKPGDVLLTIVGTIGRTAVVPRSAKPFALQRSVAVLKPTTVAPRYLAYCLESPIQQQWLLDNAKGTAQKGVYLKTLGSAPIPIAPTKQQTRIVEKLEELLSDLDVGVAELKAAQRKLAQYRQSLLKAAVEGALTAEWRAARARSGETQETGVDLLQRILTERRASWEAKQLAKYAEQGKTPCKGWQAKYPEPVVPDTDDLPILPSGWVWASLDMVGEIASGVAKGMKRSSAAPVREVPYLRVANVQRGYLDLTQIKTIEATESDIKELRLQPGDVLFNEGGDLDKLGRGWVWSGEVSECIHQNHVFRLRPHLSATPPELISHHGNTFGRTWFKTAGKQTTNLASINMTMLRAFPVPIAPEIESIEILAKLSPILDAVAAQEMSVELGLKQAAAQRKNILKAAFAGQLVPQDSNDEPASALMERIRAKRARLSPARGTARTGSNPAPATSSSNPSRRGRKPRITA